MPSHRFLKWERVRLPRRELNGTKRSFQRVTVNVGFQTDRPLAGPRVSAQQRAIPAGSELSGCGEVVPKLRSLLPDEKPCQQCCRTISQSDRVCRTPMSTWRSCYAALTQSCRICAWCCIDKHVFSVTLSFPVFPSKFAILRISFWEQILGKRNPPVAVSRSAVPFPRPTFLIGKARIGPCCLGVLYRQYTAMPFAKEPF